MWLADLLLRKERERIERWTKTAKSNGSTSLIVCYDSYSRTNFPVYDKCCQTISEMYRRHIKKDCYFIIDVIKIEQEEEEKVAPEQL